MKSLHVACAALAATAATLAVVTSIGRADALLSASYDGAFAARAPSAALVAAAYAPGSEHFWLTQTRDRHEAHGAAVTPTSHAPSTVSLDDLKQAIATSGDLKADTIEVVGVQEVARATIGASAMSAGSALLVTARIGTENGLPGRIVRFVIDPPATGAGSIARAL